MLSRAGARLQVLLRLKERDGYCRGPMELIILDEHTIERPWGWVFFYTTRGWLAGERQYAVGGNGPFFVNRNGEIRNAGTAGPVEYFIQEYEAELERNAGTWELVLLEPTTCSLHLASRIRSVLEMSPTEALALKRRLPCVLATGARIDLEPIRQRLVNAEIQAEIRLTQKF